MPRKRTPRADWRARSLTTTFVALLLATGLQPAASAYAEAFVSRSESSELDAASGWSSGGGTAIANLNGGPVDFVAIDLFSPEIRLPNRGTFGTVAYDPFHAHGAVFRLPSASYNAWGGDLLLGFQLYDVEDPSEIQIRVNGWPLDVAIIPTGDRVWGAVQVVTIPNRFLNNVKNWIAFVLDPSLGDGEWAIRNVDLGPIAIAGGPDAGGEGSAVPVRF